MIYKKGTQTILKNKTFDTHKTPSLIHTHKEIK